MNKKVEDAACEVLTLLHRRGLTPTEVFETLGRATCVFSKTVDVMYELKERSGDEIADIMIGMLDEMLEKAKNDGC